MLRKVTHCAGCKLPGGLIMMRSGCGLELVFNHVMQTADNAMLTAASKQEDSPTKLGSDRRMQEVLFCHGKLVALRIAWYVGEPYNWVVVRSRKGA